MRNDFIEKVDYNLYLITEKNSHRVTDNHGRARIVVGEIEAHLHARVATADDEHALGSVPFTAAVVAGVHELPLESSAALDIWNHRLGVLPRGHHQPVAAVHSYTTAERRRSAACRRGDLVRFNPPEAAVEFRANN